MTLADDYLEVDPRAHSISGRGSVAERMDGLPLTWLHVAIAVVASLGFAFDLMEVALGNVLSAVFSAPPHSVDPVRLSWLLSAMYLGAIPGALAAGWFADRYGRKVMLIGVLLVLGITSLVASFSPDINSLIVARVLSGLALGAYPPLVIAFLADTMPPRRRGALIMITTGVAALGPVAMIFTVRSLTQDPPLGFDAWRWAFVLGAVGSLAVALAFLFLPESPRWLAGVGRKDDAEAATRRFEGSGTALRSPAGRPRPAAEDRSKPAKASWHRFSAVAAIYFIAPWSTVAFPLLMGAVLIEKGFALSDSLLYVGVSMFGPAVGTVIGSFFIDRIERRAALGAFGLGMAISTIVFAVSLNPLWLMVAGASFQILAMLYLPTMTTYATEQFPTEWRARTSTAAWSINRVASALAPLVLLPLLSAYGVGPMFGIMVASLILGILVVAVSPNGKAGLAVD